MKDIKPSDSVEICADIADVIVTNNTNEVGVHISNGAVLLGLANSAWKDDEDRFRYCLGWPKSKGEVPDWFHEISED